MVVATAQVLLNLLEKGHNYLSFSRINVLVLDECHAAVKSHPYNKIMAKYLASDCPDKPTVFGMTVSGAIHSSICWVQLHHSRPHCPRCCQQATPSPKSIRNLNCPVYACAEDETRDHASIRRLSIAAYKDRDRVPPPMLDILINSIKTHAVLLPDLNLTKADSVTHTYQSYGLWFALR